MTLLTVIFRKFAGLILVVAIGSNCLASGVLNGGGGGDSWGMEFSVATQQVLDYLTAEPQSLVDLDRLRSMVSQTSIESSDLPLALNGMPKDAINYPDLRKIVFSRSSWSAISDEARAALVLHEFLGLLKIDDTGYKISKLALASLTYRNSSIFLDGPVTIRPSNSDEWYQLTARVTIESYGPDSRWNKVYNAAEETVRLTFEYQGKKQRYVLPLKGHVMFAWNDNGDEDPGLRLRVMQPIVDSAGHPIERRAPSEGSIYIEHENHDFRLEFQSPKSDQAPTSFNLLGPLPNQAG